MHDKCKEDMTGKIERQVESRKESLQRKMQEEVKESEAKSENERILDSKVFFSKINCLLYK